MKKGHIKWPVKVRKFGIHDPILKLVVAKYEKEIPWQTEVKDEASLKRFIREQMLKELYAKISLSRFKKTGKGFFIGEKDVNIKPIKERPQCYPRHLVEIVKKHDEKSATQILVDKINKSKERKFREWKKVVHDLFPDEPQFALAFLRPLFELNGKGVRTPLPKPKQQILLWLNRRMKKEKIDVNVNPAKLYFEKLAPSTNHPRSVDGWRFVDYDVGGPRLLSALSRGSGWCIENISMAESYLSEGAFYILIFNKKPQVAIYVTGSGVKECVERHNASPSEWIEDIALFLKIMNFNDDLTLEHNNVLDHLNIKDLEWWKERKRIFPFSVALAPEKYRKILEENIRSKCAYYEQFPNYESLMRLIGVDPQRSNARDRYNNILKPLKCHDKISKSACIKAWTEKAEEYDITLDQLKQIPEFVWKNRKFYETLVRNLPLEVKAAVRTCRNTYIRWEESFDINEYFPISPNDPPELTLERMINTLLDEWRGVYSDEIFHPLIRERKNFKDLRRKAWLEALKVEPPLYFALPEDLKQQFQGIITPDVKNSKLLTKWKIKILKKPWTITRKNYVPKSIKLNIGILKAYRASWMEIVKDTPFRLWKPVSCYLSFWIDEYDGYEDVYFYKTCRKAHLSYALLNDETFLQALKNGWLKDKFKHWNKTQDYLKELPGFQYAVLSALLEWTEKTADGSDMEIIERIFKEIQSKINEPLSKSFLKLPLYPKVIGTLKKLEKMIA